MSEIKNFDKSSIDFSKISTTASDARSGNFIPQSSIHPEYWGDPEELTFEDDGKGSVLIKNGDTAMGWTTIEAIKNSTSTSYKQGTGESRAESYNNGGSTKNSNPSVNLGQYRILGDGEVGYPLGKKISNVNNDGDELARTKEILEKSDNKESSLLEVKSNFNIRTSLDNMDQKWIDFAERATGVDMPNCYTYARARVSEILNVETTISDVPIGHAGNLWEIHNDDYVQSDKPEPGALMIWKNRYDPVNSFGHVAVCEKVNTDGSVEWSQSNYGGPMFQYETGDPSVRYIDNSNLQFMGYLVPKKD